MEQGTTYWLNMLANFRKGELLLQTIKEKEAFLRYPQVLSPLSVEDYRRLTSFEVPGTVAPSKSFWDGDEILWDSIILDKATRKYVFVSAFSAPEEIMSDCPHQWDKARDLVKEMFSVYRAEGEVEHWLQGYFDIAARMALIQYFNDPRNDALERGYRAELFLLFLADDYTAVPYSTAQWREYEETMWRRMMGKEDNLPRSVFTSIFSVGEPLNPQKKEEAAPSIDLSHLAFLGIGKE